MDHKPPSHNLPSSADESARVMELLPWYVRGALGADDHAFVHGWLQAQPSLPADITAELAWLRSTEQLAREAAQARGSDAAERRLMDEGLARLMARMRAEPAPTVAAPAAARLASAAPAPTATNARTQMPPGLWQRVAGWLAQHTAPRQPAWSFAMLALVVVQAGVIATLLGQTPAEQAPLAGAAGPPVETQTVVFTVAFKPQATEQAIRELLARAQGQLVAGPSALGLYRVAVPQGQAAAAQAVLAQAAAVVESVQPERP